MEIFNTRSSLSNLGVGAGAHILINLVFLEILQTLELDKKILAQEHDGIEFECIE